MTHPMYRSAAPLSLALILATTACNGDPGDDSGTAASTGAATTGATADPSTSTGDRPTTDGTSATTEPTTTGGEQLSRIDQILAALGVGMYACPERIWPDIEANYRARQVLLVSESENLAWLWNNQFGAGEPPRVSKGPLDGLPVEWSAVFNVGELQGVPTLGISLDWTATINESAEMDGDVVWPDFAVSLTFHEAFHFLSDQDDWNPGDGDRTAPYPEPWQPRYLRAALARALLAEIEAPGGSLPAAAHWQQRLLAEHTAEMQSSKPYDVTEGSAEYVSLMMSALAELGCDASDDELLATAVSHLHDGVFLSFAGFDPGREFYDLGVLGGLLLRRAGAPGWELKVEDGAPPVEQVLAGVDAEAQPDDAALQAEVQAAVAARNVEVGMEIDPLIANMQDPAYTRVVVDFNWIAGAYGVGGFYYLADDPEQTDVFLRFDAVLDPPSGVQIEIKELTALVGLANPCALNPGYSIVVAVPTADLAIAGGKATATAPTLTFTDLEVETTTDMLGLPWLCPVDAGGAGGAPAPSGPHDPVLRPRPRPL